MIKIILLYIHTIKYLRFVQIFNRIKRKYFKPKPIILVGKTQNIAEKYWITHFYEKRSLFKKNRCVFLNQHHQINSITDWNNSNKSDLWTYNLHYFNDLNAFDTENRCNLQIKWIDKWVNENPIGIGKGWDPYPISIRTVNWIKGFKSGLKPS